jgi:hypothetical protein
MRLNIIVLLLAAFVLVAPDVIAMVFYAPAEQLRAVKAWEYITHGLGAGALAGLVGVLAWGRTGLLSALPVPMWLAFEETQRGVCRLAYPIGSAPPPAVELFNGLCGQFWYSACLLALAVFAAWIAYKGEK